MTDVKTVMAVGGFLLDVYLEAHASAEARQTGRPRQARGPEFGDVLKKAGGSPSLLDLRGTLAKFGGTATVTATATDTTPPGPPPTPNPTTRDPEAELVAIFAEADAARAKLDESRRAVAFDDTVLMLVELRQLVGVMGEELKASSQLREELKASHRELAIKCTELTSQVALLTVDAAKPREAADDAAKPAEASEPAVANSAVATTLCPVTSIEQAELTGAVATTGQADRLTVHEGGK